VTTTTYDVPLPDGAHALEAWQDDEPQPYRVICDDARNIDGTTYTTVQATAIQHADCQFHDGSVHEAPHVYLGDNPLRVIRRESSQPCSLMQLTKLMGGSSMTDPHIERCELRAIPSIESGPVDQIGVYSVVTSGAIRGQVERFCYWHPIDGRPLDVVFEARIWALPETCGTADVHATSPETLHRVAAVCAQLAVLLEEAQTRPDLVRGFFLDGGNQSDVSTV
jgi:hypothetical protein